MRRVEEKIITDDEFNHLRSQIVISSWSRMLRERVHNPDFNCGEFAIIKSQAGLSRFTLTPKQWIEKSKQTVGQISSQSLLQSEKSIAKQAAAQFETKVRQQAVAQLTQIPWGQNITKNLPDEFRSSLPSIEEIEAELSGREESQ